MGGGGGDLNYTQTHKLGTKGTNMNNIGGVHIPPRASIVHVAPTGINDLVTV